MSKFVGLFARKPGADDAGDEPAQPAPADAANATDLATNLPDNLIEIDEELFSGAGAQIGGENESLRNLMLDANAKIGELDTIKAAVGKLVDPLAKTLRAYEAEKSEKIGLQTVLNNTRAAYGKLRNEVAELEQRASSSNNECRALAQDLAAAQNLLRTLEASKAEVAIDLSARRAQIADLEGLLAQEAGENKALRDENLRLDERLVTTDKRIIALESDLNAARQRLLMADDEKRAQQSSLDKASAECARLSRKLVETEASLTAAQGRLRHVEGNFAELNTERARLTAAFDESNERHQHELTSQRMRFDALQARASATEKLLVEAREHMLARAEEIREYDRRSGAAAMERDALQARLAELEAERIKRESAFKELDQVRITLMEHSGALARNVNAKDAGLTRAADTIASLNERINGLEADLTMRKQAIDEANAALRRERLERSVVEGALETTRKDFGRVMREVMALQRSQQATEVPATQQAANAA